ncbi:MAG: CoA-binding protein, partial [Promethearchaeota archaeon]
MTIESLKVFFEPESVAVVGASRDPNKGGSIIVGNLKRWSKSVERVYPINPGADKILELKAYPSLKEIPDEVELVVVLTPAGTLPAIMKDAAEKKAKAVIIESAGFAEVGPQGIALQEEVVRIAKSAGIRIIGPNCTGVINANNNLITTFVEVTDITKGGVSVVAQTGMFAGTLIPEFISQNLGLSKVAC